MDNRDWMYTGRISQWKYTEEWGEKTKQFVDRAFDIPTRPITVFCPCSKCGNEKSQDKQTMSLHLIKSGFTPGYKTWTFHGEKAKKRARKKVRQIEPTREYDTGFDRCLENLANGNVPERPHVEADTPRDAETSEEPEENTRKYYEALFASQKPVHGHTDVSQLDAIARLLAFKCHRNLCRDGFDELLVLVGSILPKGHLLPQNFYHSTKLLSDLKMSSQQIHCCPKGCMLFRKEHVDLNYCIKCKSSRYFEVDTNGDSQKRQTSVALTLQEKELKTGVPPKIFGLFQKTKQRKEPHPVTGSLWVNEQAEAQCDAYVSKFKKLHGETSEPTSEDFDVEVAVLAGQGKKGGRLWFCDGLVDPKTIPHLRQLRRGRTSEQPRVETRPRASDLAVERLRAEMVEKERRNQELMEEKERRSQEEKMQMQQQLRESMEMQKQLMQQMAQQQQMLNIFMSQAVVTSPPAPGMCPPVFNWPLHCPAADPSMLALLQRSPSPVTLHMTVNNTGIIHSLAQFSGEGQSNREGQSNGEEQG